MVSYQKKNEFGQGSVYNRPAAVPKGGDLVIRLSYGDSSNNGKYAFYRTAFARNVDSLVFPIGKTGKEYRFTRDLVESQGQVQKLPEQIVVSAVASESFKALGLSCRVDARGRLIVEGVPTRAIEADVYVEKDIQGENRSFVLSRLSIVEDDPFALWQVNEPPANAPYWTPNDVCEGRTVKLNSAAFNVLAASKRGRMHEHNGTFRDDNFAVSLSDDPYGWHVFVVADGAGSAKYSREGSRIACRTIVDKVNENLKNNAETIERSFRREIFRLAEANDSTVLLPSATVGEIHGYNILDGAVYSAISAVFAEADKNKRYGVTVKDYYTTLLCAVVKRFGRNHDFGGDPRASSVWAIVTYWVGDGGLALLRPNGKDAVELLGSPDGGQYAGETRFLTMREEAETVKIRSRIRVAFARSFDALILATDGVTDPFFTSDAALNDFNAWNEFWTKTLPKEAPNAFDGRLAPSKRAGALLEGMKFKVKGNHDDRTILAFFPELGQSRLAAGSRAADRSKPDVPTRRPADLPTLATKERPKLDSMESPLDDVKTVDNAAYRSQYRASELPRRSYTAQSAYDRGANGGRFDTPRDWTDESLSAPVRNLTGVSGCSPRDRSDKPDLSAASSPLGGDKKINSVTFREAFGTTEPTGRSDAGRAEPGGAAYGNGAQGRRPLTLRNAPYRVPVDRAGVPKRGEGNDERESARGSESRQDDEAQKDNVSKKPGYKNRY